MTLTQVKRFLIGRPFPLSAERHERLDKIRALAIFASDPISSNAYATEAIMGILIVLGSNALALAWPIALAIAALVTIVIFSYVQTILHYRRGGGAYFVSKDNLGVMPSLVAAGALLMDYILTVSVSISAGVRAVTSAFPQLYEYRVLMALAVIVLITWVNLRGLRESGTIFALPTYAFVIGVLAVIAQGLARYFGWFGLPPLEVHPDVVQPLGTFSQAAYLWLILRAFAAGCTALTGIEAISDGVQAFRPPEHRNAAQTMVAMGIMAMSLFLGISYLATHLRIVPTEENSVLSQMTQLIAGSGFLYYWVQLFTMLILFLAANTGYQDFPRLSAFLARDGFMPRWLQNRGDRLVFSSGIITLSVLAGTLIIVFQANEIEMLPLYALGVMTSFTLSQAGMVRLMEKVGRIPPGEEVDTGVTTIRFEAGWKWKRAVSAVGSAVTFIVLIVLVTTKFLDGAWIVVLAVPLLVLLFRGINHHYQDVAAKLSTSTLAPHDVADVADVVIVPIADIHRGTLRALKYARRLSNDIRVVNISQSEAAKQRIRERWKRFPELTDGAKLIIIDYQYRDILEPLIRYIQHVNRVEFPDKLTTVVVPEFIPRSFADQLLHNQTANLLRHRLRAYPDVVIIQVPHHL
ncbi:MAG: APC family permease [Anaerolineae bacterium]|nr:APC family permease [Anaerolineae bacterium]